MLILERIKLSKSFYICKCKWELWHFQSKLPDENMQPVSSNCRVVKKVLMMMYKTSLSDMFFVLQILDILLFHTTEWTAEAKQWQYIHEAKYVACYVTTCDQIIFDFFFNGCD